MDFLNCYDIFHILSVRAIAGHSLYFLPDQALSAVIYRHCQGHDMIRKTHLHSQIAAHLHL